MWTSIYDDATLQKQLPYLTTLKASILGAQARPKVVRYGDATLAIQDAAYGALQGTMTMDQALQQLQDKLDPAHHELIRATENDDESQGGGGPTWPAAPLAEEGQTWQWSRRLPGRLHPRWTSPPTSGSRVGSRPTC